MATFLPFCAHCEKQIVVPNTTILYCSEKCRKLDKCRPTSISLASTSCPVFPPNEQQSSWPTPPLTPSQHATMHSYFEGPPMKNYVTPSSPTPPRSTPTFEYNHGMMSPPAQEFVPVMPTTPASHSARPTALQRSFSSGGYSPTDPATPSSPTTPYSNIYNPSRGRGTHHFRTFTSSGGSAATAGPGGPATAFANTYQRPLPPLHRPYSMYSSSPRSIDLVTPISPTLPPAPPTSSGLARSASSSGSSSGGSSGNSSPTCAELLYEHSWIIPTSSTSSNSSSEAGGPVKIKTMFNFEKIRGQATAATMSRTASGGAFVNGMGGYGYGGMRTTQMPRDEGYGVPMQGMVTVLRN
ncbi:hypothetical protein DFH27DRAFT_16792 [Peziza echinospora]|nr:hypothetical protein DFH27DRAFT_16792 [Peziza echinospora]